MPPESPISSNTRQYSPHNAFASHQDPWELSSLAGALASPEATPCGSITQLSTFRPIVLPQTTGKLINTRISPFARAYPVELEPVISPEQFLNFVDQLNEAFLVSPIIRLLGLSGAAMSIDPTGIMAFVGLGVQVGAGLIGETVTYARTKSYIESANRTLFRPCGLRVRVLATKRMMQAIGMPETKRFIMEPLPEFDGDWDPKAPEMDPRRRRLTALGSDVADLDWDVAPMQTPDNFMKKLGAWHAEFLENSQRKKQNRSLRQVHRRDKAAAAATASTNKSGSYANKYDAKRAKAMERLKKRGGTSWARKRYEKAIKDINREEAKAQFKAKVGAKLGLSKQAKTQRKANWERKRHAYEERRYIRRIRWIVITRYDWEAEGTEDLAMEVSEGYNDLGSDHGDASRQSQELVL